MPRPSTGNAYAGILPPLDLGAGGGMPWPKFLVLTAVSAALWVGARMAADDVTGRHTGTIHPMITRYGTHELAAVALVAALLLMRLGARRRFVRGCHRDQ